MDKKIEFWDTDHAEVLYYTEEDEAIENILDNMHPVPIPKELTIYGYARTKPMDKNDRLAETILETSLEHLDEIYGNPEEDNHYLQDVEGLRTVCKIFVKDFLKYYTSWQCEVVDTKTINTVEWVKKEAPHWMEEGLEWESEE